jgi:hypothetical protein
LEPVTISYGALGIGRGDRCIKGLKLKSSQSGIEEPQNKNDETANSNPKHTFNSQFSLACADDK